MTRSRELAELASAYDSGNSLGFRNRIINGDMRIDQRNNGAAVTFNGASQSFITDRFSVGIFGSTYSNPTMTAQQVTDAPTGFTNSLRVTSSSTIAPDSNRLGSFFEQKIEGFNVSDLAWGTASASAVTVCFRIRASKTGTVSVSIENSSVDRSYLTTVTVGAPNTWETKTVTIPGDTSGTWLTNNGMGLSLKIGIMSNGSWLAGTGGSWSSTRAVLSSLQTNFIAVSGDNIAITGVQLEAGSVASPFERRDYGRELQMCQRYGWRIANGGASRICMGGWDNSTSGNFMAPFPVTMRATPTMTVVSTGTVLNLAIAWHNITSLTLTSESNASQASLQFAVASSGAAQGKVAIWGASAGSNPDAFFSAEL